LKKLNTEKLFCSKIRKPITIIEKLKTFYHITFKFI
jgi:hypothetical protein